MDGQFRERDKLCARGTCGLDALKNELGIAVDGEDNVAAAVPFFLKSTMVVSSAAQKLSRSALPAPECGAWPQIKMNVKPISKTTYRIAVDTTTSAVMCFDSVARTHTCEPLLPVLVAGATMRTYSEVERRPR